MHATNVSIAPVNAARRPTRTDAGADARTVALNAAVVAASLALGVAGDALFGPRPLGAGGTLFTLLLLAAAGGLGARAGRLGTEARALIAVAAGFASAFAWRDSWGLSALNALSVAAALALLAASMRGGDRRGVRGAWFRDYAAAAVRSVAWSATAAPFVALTGSRWRPESHRPRHLGLGVAARAVLISAPLLLIFGGLLTAADPMFARLIRTLFAVDQLNVPLRRVLTILLFAWPAAGYLYGAVLAPRRTRALWVAAPLRVGIAEVVVALGSINVLFLAFVCVQMRYLFGGSSALGVAGMTYAQYARRGFFELVWVTALVLPVLLVARTLLGRASPHAERAYRVCGATMLVLVLMIVASAMYRMRMYQAEYGLTVLRLYTSVFMWWIVGVLGLFAITVLQGRRRGLAFGALSSGWAVVAGLNVVNPDAVIVRVNAERAASGRAFDAAYAAQLSDDAAPALYAVFRRLRGEDRCRVASRLTRSSTHGADWRAWSLADARAARVSAVPRLRHEAARCKAAAVRQRGLPSAAERARAGAAAATASPAPPGGAR